MAEEALLNIIIIQAIGNDNSKQRIQRRKENPAYTGFEELFVFLLMTVFSQSFFSLVRCDLMALAFLTTRHTVISF